MKSWTLSNYLKNKLWVQYVLAFVPMLFILVYLGFFVSDLVNIVGIIEYNNDIVRMSDEQAIQPVDVIPVGKNYYIHFKDIDLLGSTTVKVGDKILDITCGSDDVYEIHFNNGEITRLEGVDLENEFEFSETSDDTILLSIYLGDDGIYQLKYPDGTEKEVDSISFLQYTQNGDEYKFTPQYTRVYPMNEVSELIITEKPEVGYYFDIGHNTLLHNDGKGAMQTFLDSSNLFTIVIVFAMYTLVMFLLSRDKGLKILSKLSIFITYVVFECILVALFTLAYMMY